MRLTDGAGDGADRAVACAERAALALVRIDDVIREGLAGACRAAMLGDVRNVLITVILECEEPGSALSGRDRRGNFP